MTRTVGTTMASGGLLSLVRLATGIVRVKILALVLGASGIGVYSLLLQVYLTALPIVSMGLAIPIINLGRRHVVSGQYADAGSIAGTALAVLALNTLLLSVAAALFGPALFSELGVGEAANGLVWPIVIATLFGALAASFWEGLSYLCDRFDAYVRVGIIGAVVEMLVIAVAAWLYGLRGAIVAIPAAPLMMFASYWLVLRRDPDARQVLSHLSFRRSHLRPLLAYSAMMFGAGALINIGITYLRSRVLIEAGPAANGLLQVATSMAAYILSFVTTGFYGHLHARAAAAGDTPEVRIELHNALRLGLLIAFSGCGTAAVLADFLIPLFYSGEFRPGTLLLTAYMPAELCYQLLILLMGYQLTVSRRRRYLAWGIGYVGLLVAVGSIAIPAYGALGYVAAHMAAGVVMLSIACFICWRTGQVRTSMLVMAAASVAYLAAMSAILTFLRSSGPIGMVGGVALVPIAVTAIMAARELFGSTFKLPKLKRTQ